MCINVCRFKKILSNKITKNFPRSLHLLEVNLHVYISFFFIEIVCFDFNAFHIRVQMYKCMRACMCMHAWVFGHLEACTCVHTCVCVHA